MPWQWGSRWSKCVVMPRREPTGWPPDPPLLSGHGQPGLSFLWVYLSAFSWVKYLKNVKMSLSFEDPGQSILTQEEFWNVMHWVWKALCFRDGKHSLPWSCWLGDVLSCVDLISVWEAVDENNQRPLSEIHAKISQLPLLPSLE